MFTCCSYVHLSIHLSYIVVINCLSPKKTLRSLNLLLKIHELLHYLDNKHSTLWCYSPALRCKTCLGYGGHVDSLQHSAILRELKTYGLRDCLDNSESDVIPSVECAPPESGMVTMCVAGNVTATKLSGTTKEFGRTCTTWLPPPHNYTGGLLSCKSKSEQNVNLY